MTHSENAPSTTHASRSSWAPTIAMSWFWGLGFFYSFHVSLTYGLVGFLCFAIPNAVGLAMFGILGGRPGVDVEKLIDRFESGRLGLLLLGQVFAVAVTLQAFHSNMMAPLLGDAAVLATAVLAIVSFAIGHRAGLVGLKGIHRTYLLIGFVVVAAIEAMAPAGWIGASPFGVGPDATFLGLVVPTLVGFALGPWCDVQQWHRLREIRREGRDPAKDYALGATIFFVLLCINHLLAAKLGVASATSYPDGTFGMSDAVARGIEAGSPLAMLFLAWGILAMSSTLDGFYASTSMSLRRIVSSSVNPILAFVPAGLASSPLPTFAVAAALAVAFADLPMIYLMAPFATLLVPSAAGAVADAMGSRRRDDATMNLLLGVLATILFFAGYWRHESAFLVAISSIVALIAVLFRRPGAKETVADIAAPVATGTAIDVARVQPSANVSPSAAAGRSHGFRDGWFEMTAIPTYDDTNSVGNVYFANYVRWVGKVRELFFDECMPLFDLRTTRFLILTKSIAHDYRREVAEFDPVVVRIRIGSHNRKFVTLEHEIRDESGDLVGKGKQVLMFVDSSDYRPLDIPKDVVAAFLPHWPKDSRHREEVAAQG